MLGPRHKTKDVCWFAHILVLSNVVANVQPDLAFVIPPSSNAMPRFAWKSARKLSPYENTEVVFACPKGDGPIVVSDASER